MRREDDVFKRQQLSKLLSTDKIEVVGISGVNHKIEIYPVSFSDGEEIEKDLLKLKLICIDLDIPKGILVVTKDIKISEEIERMAKDSEIILVKSLSEEEGEH